MTSSDAAMHTAAGERPWQRWLPTWRSVPSRGLRLFCFPHAGAGAGVFHSWNAALPALDVCALEYPGRWSRWSEAPCASLRILASSIADELEDLLQGRYALFGHSYGALVAFEVAREVRRRGRRLPEQLFVSAAPAPQLPRPRDPISALPDAPFVSALARRYGALPPAIVGNPELLDLLVPALRADLTAFETYTCHEETPLQCPVTALRGRDDHTVDDASLQAWRDQAGASFAVHVFAGDHDFMSSSTEVLSLVRDALAALQEGDGIACPT